MEFNTNRIISNFVGGAGTGGSSRGGFYLDPNPMQEGKNYFPAWLGSPSAQDLGDRNYAILQLNIHISNEEKKACAEDQQRMVVIHYSTGTGTDKTSWVFEYLVAVGVDGHGNNHWENPFGIVTGDINLSTHSIVELKDGEFYVNAINTLEHNQTNLIADTAANMHDIRMIDADLKRGDFKLIGDTEETQQYVLDCAKAKDHFSSDILTISDVGSGANCKIGLNIDVDKLSTIIDPHSVVIPEVSTDGSGNKKLKLASGILESDTRDSLNSTYPASDYKGRLAHVKKDSFPDFNDLKIESLYFSDGVSWNRISVRTIADTQTVRGNAWSGDLMADLILSNPRTIQPWVGDATHGNYRAASERFNNYAFVRGGDDTPAFNNPNTSESEGYIMRTMVHKKGTAPTDSTKPYTGSVWIQFMHSLSTGRMWKRTKREGDADRPSWIELGTTKLNVKGKKTDGTAISEVTDTIQFIDGLTVQKESDGSIKVKAKATKQMESFLGFYDSEAAIFAKAIEKKTRLIPEVTTAYLRHAPFGVTTEEAGSYEIYRWKGVVSKPSAPTDDDIKNVNNWHTGNKLATSGYPIVLLGSGTSYSSWTPTNNTTYQPAHYTGQVIYHTNDKSWYWSEGTKWEKLFPVDAGTGLFLGSFGNVDDLPSSPTEGSFAYVLNPVESGVIQRGNPTLYMYQGSRWVAKYPRGSLIAKASSGNWEHIEKIEVTGSIAQTIEDGKLHLDLSSLSQGDFKGFFNDPSDLPKSAVSANESYAYVFTAAGEGSVSAGKLIPQLYVYQVQGGSVVPTWAPHHTKGAIICNTDKGDADEADRPITSIKFTGDKSKRIENPNRTLTLELPFTMDSHFVGIFDSMNAFTEAAKTYAGKFVKNQITGVIKQLGEYKLVRWNQADEAPTLEEIANELHWDHIPLGSSSGGGSKPLYNGQPINALTKNDKLYSFNEATGELTGHERDYEFLGFYETSAELREYAVTVANHLVKNITFGLVRKTAVGTNPGTHYYKIHIWNLDTATPSDEEVRNKANWDNSNTILNKDYAITLTGIHSEHDTWTPTAVISTMPANKHVGQIVYYNKGASADTGHYFSDGNIWNKMPTSQKVTPITAHTENQPEGEFQAISKIDIIGDSTLANIEDGELTINVKSAVVRAADETELKSKYPVSQSFSTIGMTEDNDTLWLVRKGNAAQGTSTKWENFGYISMGNDIADLTNRYPHDLSNPMASYHDDNYKKLCRISFSEEAAKNSLHVPVPQVGVLENDYLGVITGTQEHWVQTFTGFETGEKWTRRKTPSGATNEWSDWKEVVQKLPLDDTNFTILTIKNGTKGKDIQGAAMPWRKVQDNTCNVKSMNHNTLRIMRDGKYRITVVTHFSGKTDWSGHSANVTTELFFAGESAARHKKAGTITAGGSGTNPGEYPAAKAVFEIDLASHETFDIRHIVTKGGDSYIDESDLDPFKNYVVIEPVNSVTNTGVEIAETLYESLGGLSFLPGQEVRMEPYGSGDRVVGERYRTDTVDLV